MTIITDKLDEHTVAIYLEVPGSKIVLLQAYFEIYEGVGVVRTLDVRKSLACVLTTPSLLNDCMDILNGIRGEVPWRSIEKPAEAEEEKYNGYFSEKRK